jgi:hypothetical protein
MRESASVTKYPACEKTRHEREPDGHERAGADAFLELPHTLAESCIDRVYVELADVVCALFLTDAIEDACETARAGP